MGPGDLLIAVEAAVLGAPEVHALAAGRGVTPGGAAVGEVVAAGEAATDRIGQRVLVGPIHGCGECDVCRRGHPAVCPARKRLGIDVDGALGARVVAPARWVTSLAGPLAGAVPGPAAAALAREAPLAYEMISRAGIAPGETTIWLGGGPIARFGMALAAAKGALATALEPAERELDLATLRAAVLARLSTPQVPALPWRVFEVSGRAGWRARAAALAWPGGTVTFLGNEAAGSSDGWPAPAELLDADVTIMAVAGAHPDLVPEVVALAVRGDLDVGGAVEVHPLASLEAVVASLRAGADDRLAVIDVRAG